MKENIANILNQLKTFWEKRSRSQKVIFISSTALVVLLIAMITYVSFKQNYVPLYSNLSLQETGQIKDELEDRGIPYKIENDGTTILVPEEVSSKLLVDFAAKNIPNSGNIDYSFFSDNASWGMTDQEFNMIKLDAMNTELANLIKQIEGIDDAQVMITLPRESIFVQDQEREASASIIIHTQHGYQFQKDQIESLYHLVSKAVPNLPKENIVIRNQHLEYFDDYFSDEYDHHQTYTYQQSVKKEIERDIQRRLQQMLGVMVGADRVFVSVTADIDFAQENRVEELVEPVDLDNMEGIPVSIETIHETYSGQPQVGGIPGSGEDDIPGQEALEGSGDGEYELVKETINHEFNHIRKEIVESPYKIRDLGIQVAVDNVVDRSGPQVQYLTLQEQNNVSESIASILESMISTSIDKEYGEFDPMDKISIVFQEFSGVDYHTSSSPQGGIPMWVYGIGIIFILALMIALILFVRMRRKQAIEEEEVATEPSSMIPEIESQDDTPTEIRRRHIERLAEEKPEDFAKLLRSWIAED